jgi:uncharacterized phage infection (PIP) family protein YhgE
MAKKSRRAKAKQRARVEKAAQERHLQQPAKAVEQSQPQQPMPVSTKLQSPTRVSPKAQAPKAQDLTSRYQYVIPEVKRIGIIAGAIIVVLIILSFVLG